MHKLSWIHDTDDELISKDDETEQSDAAHCTTQKFRNYPRCESHRGQSQSIYSRPRVLGLVNLLFSGIYKGKIIIPEKPGTLGSWEYYQVCAMKKLVA